MPSVVPNELVEESLRSILVSEGFSLNKRRAHGETGVDMVASQGTDVFHIEVIGYKTSGPARAKDFFQAFFRVLSRLNDDAKNCVIAVSHRAEVGLPARAKQHRVAWLRLADAFPELAIWLVDTDAKTYRRCSWREWAVRS